MSTQIVEKLEVGTSCKEAFELSQDYDRRLDWDPFLAIARLIDAGKAGKGLVSYCESKSGIGMETVYVSFDAPRTAAVKMTKGPFYFKNFAASWRFREAGEVKCEIIFTYSFELIKLFRPVTPLVKAILRREMRKRLVALSNHLER
jgi:hypothetical protein